MAELLELRASDDPDGTAFSFTVERQRTTRTYAELWSEVRGKAATIAELTSPGDRCLVAAPPSVDMLTTTLAVGVAGRAVVPVPDMGGLDAARIGRCESVVKDCAPSLVITGDEGVRQHLLDSSPAFTGRCVVASVPVQDPDAPLVRPELDDTFMLQYTSGSVGAPKGVRLTHGNLLHNTAVIARAWHLSTSSVCVSWLPLFHDMGLIGAFLVPLRGGFPVHLIPTVEMVRHPMNWLRLVSDERATVSGAPDFAYRQCVERVSREEMAELDLSRWEIAFSGSESVSQETMTKFSEHFAPAGFRPTAPLAAYGLAENTLYVTGSAPGTGITATAFDSAALEREHTLVRSGGDGRAVTLVANGPTDGEIPVQILLPDGTVAAEGEIGEVVLRQTPSTSLGYHHGDAIAVDGILRTGDLGGVIEGQLYLVGRLKDVLVFSGQNVYPLDVELTVQAAHPDMVPGLGAAFALSDEIGRDTALVIVQAVRAGASCDATTARELAVSILRRHGIPVREVVLVDQASVPLTASGKVTRSEAKRRYEAGELNVLASSVSDEAPALAEVPADIDAEDVASVTSWIMATVAQTSGGSLPANPRTSFVELGLDSVTGVALISSMNTRFGTDIPIAALFDHPTPADLAELIVSRRPAASITTSDPTTAELIQQLRDELKGSIS